jgi:hypothetical protein
MRPITPERFVARFRCLACEAVWPDVPMPVLCVECGAAYVVFDDAAERLRWEEAREKRGVID